MGVNALQIQMAALVADTESAILSPSAQKLESLAEAAAEISVYGNLTLVGSLRFRDCWQV